MRSGAIMSVGSIRCQPRVLEPHLAPRVRVGLPDDDVFAERVELAAVVADDHARRDAGERA